MRDNKPLPPEIYARVFEGDPNGAVIFDELTRRFARPPVLTGGIDGVRQSDYRAGARAVIEFIVNRINQAHGVNAPDPNEETPDE